MCGGGTSYTILSKDVSLITDKNVPRKRIFQWVNCAGNNRLQNRWGFWSDVKEEVPGESSHTVRYWLSYKSCYQSNAMRPPMVRSRGVQSLEMTYHCGQGFDLQGGHISSMSSSFRSFQANPPYTLFLIISHNSTACTSSTSVRQNYPNIIPKNL